MKHRDISLSNSQTKLIVLWTAPRCVSTAFEKAFDQRPNTAIIHEPFLDVYFYSQWQRSDRFGVQPESFNYDTNQVIDQIESHMQPEIFVKAMAFQALPYIEHKFVDAPLINTFLIRHPKKSLLSWYKVNEIPTEEQLGFTSLQSIWDIVCGRRQQPPIVVEADRLQSNPKETFKKYCDALQIEFLPAMLSWEREPFQQKTQYKANLFQKWHTTLNESKGIRPPTEAIFEIRPEDMPMLKRAMVVYEKLSQYACA